ncbi:MAG: putative sensor domain DACNV-containing protein [Acidobacteriota bacterium]
MSAPPYPAARAAAATLERYFARHASPAETAAPPPTAADIEGLIDAAFWASLRREEGYVPKISLALLRPEHTVGPMLFERPLALGPVALAKMAPAVERPGVHLGVSRDGDNALRVWGTAHAIPLFCFVLEVVQPGLLVVKHRRTEAGKFVNVLVLEADRIKVVDEDASDLPDCPPLLTTLLGFHSPRAGVENLNVLVELAVSMRAHHRGGSLLVVPAGTEQWRESILHPVSYAVSPPFTELAALMRDEPDARHDRRWQETLTRTVDLIAGLTAVDGATVITDHYELLAFGAKIGRRDGWTSVEQVLMTEPIENSSATIVHPAELGGTRHLSAAQFIQDQREAVALVASQDGRFTLFSWSPCENMVHAHRVESLLL